MESKSVNLKTTSDLLRKTFWVSTLAFVVAGFLAQITASAWYAILMQFYDIPFHYLFTEIDHCTRSLEYWNEENILLIYGVGGVLLLALALYIITFGLSIIHRNWITLIFTLWLSIHLIGGIVGQALISIVSPNGIGHAIQWLFPGRFERVLIGFGALVLWFLTTRYWAGRFLFTARSELLVHDISDRRDYITTSMTMAWFSGTLMLVVLELPALNVNNLVSNILLGVVAIGAIYQYPLVGYIKIQEASPSPKFYQSHLRVALLFIAMVVVIRWGLMVVF